MTEEREILLHIIKQNNCSGIVCKVIPADLGLNKADCPMSKVYCTECPRRSVEMVRHACILYAERYGTEDILEYLM